MTSHPDETSPAWAVRLIAELHAADERATALAKTLTPQQLNWKPRLGAWSIGQCLEHLCVSNEFYVDAMASSLAGLEILSKHERRHLLQAERVKDSSEFPGNG